MTSNGITGFIIETHNWGKSVAFWEAVGYDLEFETDHHSGQLRHPAGGPFLFIAERPVTQTLEMMPIVGVEDSTAFEPPQSGTVDTPFTPRHWAVTEMLLCDPDGRRLSVQAPLPPGAPVPPDQH
jgi:hypothetical protein